MENLAEDAILEYIKQYINYDPQLGLLTWKSSRGRAVKDAQIGSINLGYRRTTIKGKHYLVHHLIWLLETGNLPKDCIDHINHDRLDNRFINLRAVDRIENQKNLQKRPNNTSGVTGVSWYPARNKWHQRIQVNGTQIHLGYFSDLQEAAKARKEAEILYGFHENHGV